MPNSKIDVFIVDDNEITKSLLRMMAKSESYNVVGDAGTAESAKPRLLRAQPHIVCLDVQLPDESGLVLLSWMRVSLPKCAVVMVTASREREVYDEAIRLGAKGFITKPLIPAAVLDTLGKVAADLGRASS